eukprot:536280-Ditylum_brightwellii.AAC.1
MIATVRSRQEEGCGGGQYTDWTCKVQPKLSSKNCDCPAKGHQENATIDNSMGGDNRGISQ